MTAVDQRSRSLVVGGTVNVHKNRLAATGIDRGDPDRVSDLHAAPPILIGADADAVSVAVCNGSRDRGSHLA